MNDFELRQVNFILAGNVLCLIGNDMKPQPLVNLAHVPQPYRNMIAASLLMYQQIDRVNDALATMLKTFEDANIDQLTIPLLQLQSSNNITLRAAIEGAEAVAATIKKV